MKRVAWMGLACVLAGCPQPSAPSDAGDSSVSDTSATDTGTTDTGANPVDVGTPDAGCIAPPGPALPRVGTFDPMQPMDTTLRLNHLQAKGTHNSYHLRPATVIPDWDYEHLPLDQQFESQGVRKVELDVHWNASCGYHEVFHVPRLDDRTTCRVFTDCLLTIRRWSDAHPGHHPIFIMIEPKSAFPGDAAAAIHLDKLDQQILSVFPRELVITPDEVKGTETTLERAVTTRGWPTLGASRGRVMFFMDDDADFRRVYTRGNANLDGRMLFVDSVPGEPFAAVRIMNNPVAQMADITAAVRAGYLVRTFGDESAEKVMMNNRDYVNAALASGAHIISTDHPALTAGLDFVVEIPGGTPSRCNPVNAPSGCTSTAIENPARLSP